MRFVKNFAPPDFQAKDFTPFLSLNFNSFSHKNAKNEFFFWEIYTTGKKLYTAGGSDGSDKSHLCVVVHVDWLYEIRRNVFLAHT